MLSVNKSGGGFNPFAATPWPGRPFTRLPRFARFTSYEKQATESHSDTAVCWLLPLRPSGVLTKLLHFIWRDSAFSRTAGRRQKEERRSHVYLLPSSLFPSAFVYAGCKMANTFPSTAQAQAMRHWSWRMA
jgi:hypothetical protein